MAWAVIDVLLVLLVIAIVCYAIRYMLAVDAYAAQFMAVTG